jgi:Zn-dependent M28 family amino/carboxypeptidase
LVALEELVDPHEALVSRMLLPYNKMRPVRASKIPDTPRAHNDDIQDLVDQVNQANMESTLDILAFEFGNPNSRNSNADGLDEAQVWVSSLLNSYGLNITTHRHSTSHALNTIGTLYGADRESFIVIGAHLDSRNSGTNDVTRSAPGADDNGSGSVSVLELARIITQSGLRFQYSIQFCLWTGEEQGLLGSRSYASMLADDDEDVVAYINADMIGYRVNQNSVLSLMSGSASAQLNNYIENVVAVYMPDLEVSRTNACCSDQQSFYEQGYQAASFFEHEGGAGSYPCYHQECDLPAQIDFDMLEDNAKAFMAATADLAIPL